MMLHERHCPRGLAIGGEEEERKGCGVEKMALEGNMLGGGRKLMLP